MGNYIIYRNKENELCHYGVLGMKWGIRRYQNKDGTLTPAGKQRQVKRNDDIILKKGSTTYHVTPNKNLILKNRPTFLGSTQKDLKTYTGPYSMSLLIKKNKNGDYDKDPYIYLNEYTLKNDVRSPGLKAMKDKFNNIYDKNPNFVKRAMKGYYDQQFKAGNIKNNTPYEKFSKDKKRMFSLFGDQNLTIYLQYKSQNKELPSVPSVILAKDYVESFKKEKYSAILDLYDRGKYYGAEQPIILLNGKKYLKKSKIKNMDINDIENIMIPILKDGYINKQSFIKYSDM